MKNKILLFAIFLLSVVSLNAQKWKPIIEMGENLFPSYILATANFDEKINNKLPQGIEYVGDQMGVIGMKISELPDNSVIKLEISETEFFYKSVIEDKIDDSTKTYFVFPKMNYKYGKLRQINQQTPVNVEFKLFVNGDLFSTKLLTAGVRSLEECPYLMKSSIDDSFVRINWMFAAYVNEDSPLVNQILSNALKSNIVNSFNGYQGGSKNTIKQVMAIWYALQNEGIKYSNITNTSLFSNDVGSQKVRMINQSFKHSQANCVDGTVLFASVLKAIGIDPVLIMIPGHMFLGYYVDKNHSQIYFLETTMIGSVDLKNVKPNQINPVTAFEIRNAKKRLNEIYEFQIGRTMTEKKEQIRRQKELIDKLFERAKREASIESFGNATSIAGEKYNSLSSKFGKDKGYNSIDVSKARRLVKPIWR